MMLSSWWRTLAMKRMTRAARGRTQLRAETLETRDTPAGIFVANAGPGSPPVVAVFDAVTRQQKFTINAFDTSFTGGVNLAVGDVNGDGTADVIAGAGPGGGSAINIFNGVDGALLKPLAVGDGLSGTGVSVAAADFDLDGRVEIVASGMAGGQPVVQVLRFSDGVALQTFTPFANVRGVSVAAGDFNGDGTPDVAVGAGPGGSPVVTVFDGKGGGGTLLTQQVFESSFTGGVTISAADINTDNNADIIVSARTLGGPRVTVLAGPTGAVIQNFFADSDAVRTGVTAGAFDVNSDGRLDLVTSSVGGFKTFDSRNLSSLPAPTTPGLPVGASYDFTAPTPTVTSTAANPTRTSPIPFRVAFNEVVNGFSAAGLTVTNGTVSNFVAADARTFTFDVTPAGAGAVNVTVNANAAFDAAGNGNRTGTGAVTFDTSGPAVTIAPLVTSDTTPTITGSVDDPNATVVVSVGGQTINATVASNGNYSATVTTPLAPGTYPVTVTATDRLGNTGTATDADGLIIDTGAPVPVVSTSAPEPTSTTPIPFTVAFDQDVTGFAAADVTVTNGTVSNFVAVDARTYTFNVLPAGQGAVTVSVAAGVATDAAGNQNVASNTLTRTLDNVNPTITANPLTTADNTPTLTGTVNDPAATVSVTVGGSTRPATVTGTTWSLEVTSPLADGPYTVDATATDKAGNTATTTLANGLIIDTTRPTVSVTTTSPSPTNAASFSVKVEFNEVISGFELADLSVNNGVASNLQTQDSRTFTVDITPQADGPVTVTVPANVAQDQVQLGNTEAPAPVTVTSDRTAPTPAITSTEPNPTAAALIPITVDFGEVVTDFTLADVAVGNGVASNFAGSGAIYTFDVDPTADGTVTVSVGGGVATDAAGNGNSAATFTITSDTTNPLATIGSSKAPATSASPIPFTVTFSKPVSGFELTDLTVTGGAPSNLAGSGAAYTFDVTPGAQGDVTVRVNAGSVDDGEGNTNPESSPFTVRFDTTPPGAAVSTTAPALNNLPVIPYTVTFTEIVTGFTAAGLTVANGQVSNFAGSGTTYTFSVTPTADGDVTVTVNAGAAADAAGNTSTASPPNTVTSDRTVPTAGITSTETSPTGAATIPVTVTFSESVTGFDLADVTVTGGTPDNFAGSGTTYTFDVTPDADGLITITVGAGAGQDAAGNLSDQDTFSITSDQTDPTPTVSSTVTGPTNAATIPVTVTFDEPVTGFTLAGVTVSGGVASNLSGSGTTYTFDVTPDADGTIGVTVDAAAATDAAGNPSAASLTFTIVSDQTDPTGTIDTTSAGPITGTATDVTAGVDTVRITISDGSMFWSGSAFDSATPVLLTATGDATWTYAFTGPDGTYQVTVLVTDSAGNEGGNFGGTPVDVTVDVP